jgi:CheY-like chemotaxis protein
MDELTHQQSSTLRFKREVADRFGVLPNFFCSADAAPGLVEELWKFAKSAYLDSPLLDTSEAELVQDGVRLRETLNHLHRVEAALQKSESRHAFLLRLGDVALTGFGQEQDKEKATRAGFDAHLTKPADGAALSGILADASAEQQRGA